MLLPRSVSSAPARPTASLSRRAHLSRLPLLLALSGAARADVLWTNPITDANPGAANPFTAGDTVAANITVSGIGRGAGINANAGSNRYNANSWSTAVSLSLANNDYFTWTLTPGPSYEIDFTSLVYTGQVSSGAPSFSFRSSLDSFATAITAPVAAGGTINLSGAAFQDITSPIEFRLYGFGFAAGTTTYSVNEFTFNGVIGLAGGGGGGSNSLFDANGDTPGAGALSGAYNWSGATWSSAAAGDAATGAFSSGQTATFSAGADGTGTYSVTVDEAVSTAGLTVEEGDVTLAAGAGTLTLASAAVDVAAGASLTVTEPLLGSSGLAKSGAGELTLAANSGYSGTTTVNGGVLRIGNGGAAGTVPGNLDLPAGAVVFNRSGDLAVTGAVSGSGAITKQGAGNLTLSGGNGSYTGAIALNQGALTLASATAGGTGALNVADGATLVIGNVALTATRPNLVLADGATLRGLGASAAYSKSNFPSIAAGGAVTFNVPGAGDVLTIASAVRDGNGASQVSVTGAGTLAITSGATAATSYAGSWLLDGPTLRLSDANALGNPGGASPRPLTIQAGAVETRNNAPTSHGNAVTVAASTAFTPNNAGAGTTHTFGPLTLGGHTLAVTPGAQVSSGQATVAFGATTLAGNAVFSVNNGATAAGRLVLASVAETGGSRSLTKAGSGTLVLSGGGTFSGAVAVNGGWLSVADMTGAGIGTGPVGLANGAGLELTGPAPGASARGFSLGSQGGRVNVADPAGTLTVSGPVTGLDNTSDFTKSGAGTFNLTAAGTWAGNTFVTGGTLAVTGGGSINSSGVLTVQGGARLRVDTSGQVVAPSLDVVGAGTVDLLSGFLRTNAIDLLSGSAFNWTGGTLSVRDTLANAGGNPDLSEPGGATVAGGRVLTVNQDLSIGGTLDLEELHIAGVVAFNRLDVDGVLTFQPGARLLAFDNPYLLRGSTGGAPLDAGTLPLVTAGAIAGFDPGMFSAPVGDAGRSFTPSAFPVTTATRGSLLPDTWYLEDTGDALLFHYKVTSAIPEPSSASLALLGLACLRLVSRRRRA